MFTYILILTLLSVTACRGQDSEESEEPEEPEEVLPELPTPTLTYITTFDPAGFTVQWAPVKSDDKNPVAGFKAKVWENKKEITYRREEIEGLGQVWVQKIYIRAMPLDVIPMTEPLVQTVGANDTKARFENVKLNEDYQIRVQAFNDIGDDGPYSNVLGLKIGDEEKDEEED